MIELNEKALEAACKATILGESGDYKPMHLEMREARTAISTYLSALPEQEPVAWTTQEQLNRMQADPGANILLWGEAMPHHPDIPLFASPVAHPLRDEEVERLTRERDEWRKDFDTLAKAIVGETGLSAIDEARRLRAAEAKLAALQPDQKFSNSNSADFKNECWLDFNLGSGPLGEGDPLPTDVSHRDTFKGGFDRGFFEAVKLQIAKEKSALQPDRAGSGDAVRVKALIWKGPDSSGEYYSLNDLCGYIIRGYGDGSCWLTVVGHFYSTVDDAKTAAQHHYDAYVGAALTTDADRPDTGRDGSDHG